MEARLHKEEKVIPYKMVSVTLRASPSLPPPAPTTVISRVSSLLVKSGDYIPGLGLSGHGHSLECPVTSASFNCSQVFESAIKIKGEGKSPEILEYIIQY